MSEYVDIMKSFGELLRRQGDMGRKCGDCAECCRLPSISKDPSQGVNFDKPTGETCQHCTGSGCGIYKERPSLCEGFMCSYLIGIDDRQPKDTGVVFAPQVNQDNGKPMIVCFCDDIGESLEDEYVRGEVERYAGDPYVDCVTIRTSKEAVCFTTDPMGNPIARHVDIDPNDPLKQDILLSSESGYRAWRLNREHKLERAS